MKFRKWNKRQKRKKSSCLYLQMLCMMFYMHISRNIHKIKQNKALRTKKWVQKGHKIDEDTKSGAFLYFSNEYVDTGI